MPPPRSIFTSHERAALKDRWGSQSTRLTRDSFLPFGSCQLCLLSASDPVICPAGDLFCRECAMTNLLAQRKEMKRLDALAERSALDAQEMQAREDEEARVRAVREFEDVQMGLERKGKDTAATNAPPSTTTTTTTADAETSPTRGTKRKFALSASALSSSLANDRAKAARLLTSERAAQKQHNPSFWVPGETPTAHHGAVTASKKHPTCPASAAGAPHILSLKTLTSVHFSTDERKDGDKTKAEVRKCPACTKALSNASRAVVAVPCGHVICAPCVARFLKPELRHHRDAHDGEPEAVNVHCYVCDADLGTGGVPGEGESKEGEGEGEKDEEGKKGGKKKNKGKKGKAKAGLVEIRSEGTGYASAGQSVVKREGVAFQV
jgi:nitric oxide synthase-interacting protein